MLGRGGVLPAARADGPLRRRVRRAASAAASAKAARGLPSPRESRPARSPCPGGARRGGHGARRRGAPLAQAAHLLVVGRAHRRADCRRGPGRHGRARHAAAGQLRAAAGGGAAGAAPHPRRAACSPTPTPVPVPMCMTRGCNPMCSRLQPRVLEAATPCDRGCNPVPPRSGCSSSKGCPPSSR